jgi:hypothetical protein
VCTEHTHQELMHLLSITETYACIEHTHQVLKPTLSRVYKEGTDVRTEHMHQELMHALSIHIRIAYAQLVYKKINDAFLPKTLKYLIYILPPNSPTQESFVV